jgi:hypothetical protein
MVSNLKIQNIKTENEYIDLFMNSHAFDSFAENFSEIYYVHGIFNKFIRLHDDYLIFLNRGCN